MPNDKVKIIEQLLNEATKSHRFNNSAHRLLYERGYLTGLLAALMDDDHYAEAYIKHRIKRLENSRK